LIKQLTEATLTAELEQHIKSAGKQNRKNSSTPKSVKSASGSFQLDTRRDRNGTFEPQLIKKYQPHLDDGVERKILTMFALGSSYQNISDHNAELYGIDI
jgi:putative transposase